jgi:hypothetical protein
MAYREPGAALLLYQLALRCAVRLALASWNPTAHEAWRRERARGRRPRTPGVFSPTRMLGPRVQRSARVSRWHLETWNHPMVLGTSGPNSPRAKRTDTAVSGHDAVPRRAPLAAVRKRRNVTRGRGGNAGASRRALSVVLPRIWGRTACRATPCAGACCWRWRVRVRSSCRRPNRHPAGETPPVPGGGLHDSTGGAAVRDRGGGDPAV